MSDEQLPDPLCGDLRRAGFTISRHPWDQDRVNIIVTRNGTPFPMPDNDTRPGRVLSLIAPEREAWEFVACWFQSVLRAENEHSSNTTAATGDR